MAKQRSIDPGPMQRQLATPGQYEEFGREGVKGGYRAEWYPSESILFLEPKKFVKRVEKRRELSVVRHPPLLEVLWQEAAEQAKLSPEASCYGGRSVRVVEVRDGFIRCTVVEVGYRAATVAAFVGCHAPNVSHALQRDVVSR